MKDIEKMLEDYRKHPIDVLYVDYDYTNFLLTK